MRVNRLDGAPFLRRHDFCTEGGDWFGDGLLFVRLEGVFLVLVSIRLVVLRKDEGEKWLGAFFFGRPPHRGQIAQARGGECPIFCV